MSDKQSIMKMSPEAKVGLFVLMGIIILAYMSLRIGGIRFGRAEGYSLTVKFASASGLDKDASVRVAGVEVGKVKEITLKDNAANIVLQINKGIKIGKDFTAVMTTKGLLGEKYIELIPGSPNAPALKEGDEITHTTSYADMDKLMTILTEVSVDVKNVTETLSKVLGGKEGEATLRNILKNVEEVSSRVNKVVASNDERITSILKNFDEFSTHLKTDGPQVTAELREAVRNANDALLKTSENLNGLINENRGNLKDGIENLKLASMRLQEAMEGINNVTRKITPEISDAVASVNSITKKIDKGEGTLGKLINDPSIHEGLNKTISGINRYIDKSESFRTYLGYRGEYLVRARDGKSYVYLRLQPKSDKYYLLEIVDDPRGKRRTETRTTTVGGVTTVTEETIVRDDLKFSVQIAKMFNDLTLRGGIIESTGGVGMDYYLLKNRLKLSLDVFDFNQRGNPHLKAGGTFYLNKFFYLSAGYDDIASKEGLSSAFIGLGLQFEDEDIKYLFGSVPISAVK